MNNEFGELKNCKDDMRRRNHAKHSIAVGHREFFDEILFLNAFFFWKFFCLLQLNHNNELQSHVIGFTNYI